MDGEVTGEAVAISEVARTFDALASNVERVLKGKREVVEMALVCLLAEGHLLLEDVPGVGKTTLARCLATSIGAAWRRIQFTPDLLPSDITGVTIYHQDSGSFEFRQGPVFANVVLGDEINRASPKTQSALLEVMEERHVTVEGVAHPAPRPFIVIATQNPVDMDGTYALPEAQLDRFLMRLKVGYPAHDDEVAMLTETAAGASVEFLSPVVDLGAVQRLIAWAGNVHIARPIYHYIVDVSTALRDAPDLRLGVSPRGSLALVRAVRVLAMSRGRTYAVPEDVKDLARPVLAHRLLLTPEAELRMRTGEAVLAEALDRVPAPQPATVR